MAQVLASFPVQGNIARARSLGQRTIIVVGARRSGHHAILLWLANAVEEQDLSWHELKPNQLLLSHSGQTLHLNNFNPTRHAADYVSCLKFLRQIRRARNLIVNFEDVDASEVDRLSWIAPGADLKILVTRSTLNLVASRLEKVRKNQNPAGFVVDERFLGLLMSQRTPPPDWVTVHFDAWIEDHDGYRAAIAEQCAVRGDFEPALSPFGKGSSFTGVSEKPTVASLTHRYLQVTWPDDVVDLLLRDKYSVLLTATERDFLLSLAADRDQRTCQ